MCGIAGFVGAGDLDDLGAMHARLTHRGPDGSGLWHDVQEGVYLAHRRLAVIDIEDGAQPMWTADRALGITYNGEIYNHAELRSGLERAGHSFLTDHSDTEVLLHAYREWGEGLVHRLNGMWAFALYDRRAKRMLLSRDRFGEKPLYYSCQGQTFAFASELAALTAHRRVVANRCDDALKKYFAHGFVPGPGTLFANVWKLPAGHNLVVDTQRPAVAVSRYWRYRIEPDPSPMAEESEALRDCLGAAVRARLVADAPLGVFLSGGIDSSTVAHFASAEHPGIDTFSIGFDEADFDESPGAARVAAALGATHHEQRLALARARDVLPAVAARLDEPIGDSSIGPTFMLCASASKRVKVALSGDGADELLAGYAPFRALRPARAYRRMVPRPIHRAVKALVERLPTRHGYMSLDFKLRRTLGGLEHPERLWNPVWLAPLSPAEIQRCFGEPVDPEALYAEAIEAWDALPDAHPLDRTTMFYVELYLQDDILVKTDRLSMMHGLEVRAPFLDIGVADFIRKLPHWRRLHRGRSKVALRDAMRGLLPAEVLTKPKQGFAMPVGAWLRDDALTPSPDRWADARRGAYLAARVEEHRRGETDHRLYLWSQWVLSHALEVFPGPYREVAGAGAGGDQ